MRIPWGLFKQALRDANPKLRMGTPRGSLGAMIYLQRPGSEDVVPGTDLEEVMAVASPAFFSLGCPVEDVALNYGEHPSIKAGKRGWVRGAGSLFRRMARMHVDGRPLIDAQRVRRLYPKLFRRLDAAKFKREVSAGNADTMDDLHKKAKWLKGRQKPIPGNGMPLGWKPTKIFSSGSGTCATAGGLL